MINVITALDNPILNEELKKISEINVLLNDLQYKEAIIEFLEKDIKINYLILSETLSGEIKLNNLIDIIKSKNIKIILLRERKNYKKENEEFKNVDYIFFNNEVEIIDIVNVIKNKKNIDNEKLKQDIELLKKIVLNKNKKLLKNINLNNEINNKKNNKIITILGSPGVGKSIFSIMLSSILKKENKKNLIIDFDILNNNIHTILGIKKYSEKVKNKNNKYRVEDLVINVNKNLDLISGLDLLFKKDKQISCDEIIEDIKSLKNNYNYIIIDTSSECFFEYNRQLIFFSDIAVLLIEANLLEWNINKEKIKIIINKYNNNSIGKNILTKIFDGQEILGKIQMSDYYNCIINKNNNINIKNNNVKNNYIRISKKLLKLNFEIKYYIKLKSIKKLLINKKRRILYGNN